MNDTFELDLANARIGWIGAGVMGAAMCAHLLGAGVEVHVYSRTRSRAEGLLDQGADWAATPAAAAEGADVVFTMVGFPADVREVLLGSDGVLGAVAAGTVIVDTTTSEPSLAVEIAERAAKRDVQSIDAPVSGGDVGARNAALSIMVGGEEAAVARVRPPLELMGKTVVHQGPPGAGQHTKMVNHFIKDMGIALTEAGRMNLALPGLALAHELYVALRAQGGGRDGTQALIRALATLSAVDWTEIR